MTTLLMATGDLPPGPGSYTWGPKGQMNGISISDVQARTGTYSFHYYPGTAGNFNLNFPRVTPSEIYFRVACYYVTGATYTRMHTRFKDTGPNLYNNVSGGLNLQIRNNTTVLATISPGIFVGTWTVYELKATATTITVRINGSEVYHGTGLTVNLTDLTQLMFTTPYQNAYIDDIVVCTDKWPGMGGLHVFPPTGPGTLTNWQGTLPNLNTPGATAGTKHQFTIDPAPANTMIINRLAVGAKASVNGAGYGVIKPTLNGVPGDLYALSITPAYRQHYWPGVTINDFNNLEIGVESA